MSHPGPPPPPPPPPPPAGGGPPSLPPDGRPPQGFPMQMPIRQQSTRIQDITPPLLMNESACLKKLTTYALYTLRKCAPIGPQKEKATWARAELTEERLSQIEIEKQIRKLNSDHERSSHSHVRHSTSEKKQTVAEKKAALMPNQQSQITSLLDNLGTQELDRAFAWSLVQVDTDRKPIKVKNKSSKKDLYETVTMTVYVKRAPREDLNPVMLYQNIEKMKAERMRPSQPPPPRPPQQYPGPPQQYPGPPQQYPGPPPARPGFQGQGSGHGQPQIINMGKAQKSNRGGRGKRRGRKDHNYQDDSTVGSSDEYDSDEDSTSSSAGSSKTSISSHSDRHRRRQSRGRYRSHSKHEPRTYIVNSPITRPRSTERQYSDASAYGAFAPRRPYVPEPPRQTSVIDPIISAYQAGKEDAIAERFGMNDRSSIQPSVQPPAQPVVIERIIESRPQNVVSYPRPSVERRYSEQGYRYPIGQESRYIGERYYDDLRRRDDLVEVRQRDAEEYIERVPLGREPIREPIRDSFRDSFRESFREPFREPIRQPHDVQPEYRRRPTDPGMEFGRRLFDAQGDYDIPRDYHDRRENPSDRLFRTPNPFTPNGPPPLRRVYP